MTVWYGLKTRCDARICIHISLHAMVCLAVSDTTIRPGSRHFLKTFAGFAELVYRPRVPPKRTHACTMPPINGRPWDRPFFRPTAERAADDPRFRSKTGMRPRARSINLPPLFKSGDKSNSKAKSDHDWKLCHLGRQECKIRCDHSCFSPSLSSAFVIGMDSFI